jgi:hypothetical protein
LTNSLQIPIELGGVQGIQVIGTGGAIESEFKAMYGRWVVDSIQRINLNQIFISVGTISVENGLMTQIHFINDLFPELFLRSEHTPTLQPWGTSMCWLTAASFINSAHFKFLL